mgnify:CR=1 FL=1
MAVLHVETSVVGPCLPSGVIKLASNKTRNKFDRDAIDLIAHIKNLLVGAMIPTCVSYTHNQVGPTTTQSRQFVETKNVF